jgi:hypothetical protein
MLNTKSNIKENKKRCTEKTLLWMKTEGCKWFVGGYLYIVVVGLIIALFLLWPEQKSTHAAGEATTESAVTIDTLSASELASSLSDTNNPMQGYIFRQKAQSDSVLVMKPFTEYVSEISLLLLVLIVGALGACLHALTSLSEYVGTKKFKESWALWYILRPFVGATLSILFYFVVRGGLFDQSRATGGKFYGLIALAGLVGLFSKQALYKLSDLFDVLFKSEKEDKLGNKLAQNPKPDIEKIDPEAVKAGDQNVELTVTGNDFVEESVVRINNQDLKPTSLSPTELKVKLLDKDLENEGTLDVVVVNPPPGGGASKAKTLKINKK